MENKGKKQSMFLHYYCEKCKGDEVHEIRPMGISKMRKKKGSPPEEVMEFEYACLKCMQQQLDMLEYNNRHPNNQIDFEPLYWQTSNMSIDKWNEFVRHAGYS